MAKRRSRFRKSLVQRDNIPIATEYFTSPVLSPFIPTSNLLYVEDRRRRPVFSRPIRNVHGRVAHVRPVARFKKHFSPVVFQAARDAIVCVRRSMRRQVLFATGGAGGRASRRPKRFNETSRYSC